MKRRRNPALTHPLARWSKRGWCFDAYPRAGDLIEVHTGLADVGDKTLKLVHWIVDPESGGAWASMEVTALTFDTKTRKAITMSAEARQRMLKRAVKLSV